MVYFRVSSSLLCCAVGPLLPHSVHTTWRLLTHTQCIPPHPVPLDNPQSVPYGPVPYGSVPYETVPYGSVPYEPVPYGSVPYGSVPYGTVR